MKRLFIAAGLLLCGTAPQQAAAQSSELRRVLHSIEEHNVGLRALRSENEATALEARADNVPGDLSVEFSPFYAKGTSGMASSELVVSQGFDFPTLYGARSKSARLQTESLDDTYRIARRDLLLQAQELCIDLVHYNRVSQLLDQRERNADELLRLLEKRLAEGDASLIEVNKVRMERMNIRTERTQNEADRTLALRTLRALNGDLPIDFDATEYEDPADTTGLTAEALLDAELDIRASETALRASRQELRVNRQSWLPSLEVGYRRNTALDEVSHGFIVGASFPLFASGRKARIARTRYTAAQMRLNDTRLTADARIRAQLAELEQLQQTLKTFDINLMRNTLSLLLTAVKSGQLSVIAYYTEAENIYGNMQTLAQTENRYRKLLAELRRNDL